MDGARPGVVERAPTAYVSHSEYKVFTFFEVCCVRDDVRTRYTNQDINGLVAQGL